MNEARVALALTLAVAFLSTTVVFGVSAAMVGTTWVLVIPWAVRVNRLTFEGSDDA